MYRGLHTSMTLLVTLLSCDVIDSCHSTLAAQMPCIIKCGYWSFVGVDLTYVRIPQ